MKTYDLEFVGSRTEQIEADDVYVDAQSLTFVLVHDEGEDVVYWANVNNVLGFRVTNA